jgi:V8-like Glu-specific endopeptidase
VGNLDATQQEALVDGLQRDAQLLKQRSTQLSAQATAEERAGLKEQAALTTQRAEKTAVSSSSASNLADVIVGKTDELTHPDIAYEQVVTKLNPALPTCGSSLSWRGPTTALYWQESLDKFLASYSWILKSVGRVEQQKHTWAPVHGQLVQISAWEYIGTAFLFGSTTVVTANHVIDGRYNSVDRTIDSQSPIRVNFGAEHACPETNAAPTANVVRVIDSDPSGDIATLQISKVDGIRPLEAPSDPTTKTNDAIMVVGYPGKDLRATRDLVLSVLAVDDAQDQDSDVKRLQPGEILDATHCVSLADFQLGHNASTLGNNSGSPIIRASDGKVIGVQTSGAEGACNYATLEGSVSKLKTAKAIRQVSVFAQIGR